MSDTALTFLLLPAFFFTIVLFIEVGRRLGTRYAAEETERARVVLGSIEPAIDALLGLMVAFTFSGARPSRRCATSSGAMPRHGSRSVGRCPT